MIKKIVVNSNKTGILNVYSTVELDWLCIQIVQKGNSNGFLCLHTHTQTPVLAVLWLWEVCTSQQHKNKATKQIHTLIRQRSRLFRWHWCVSAIFGSWAVVSRADKNHQVDKRETLIGNMCAKVKRACARVFWSCQQYKNEIKKKNQRESILIWSRYLS